jgi:hypothetical protein
MPAGLHARTLQQQLRLTPPWAALATAAQLGAAALLAWKGLEGRRVK